ncbi:MAG: RimK family protein [Gammaproteobacteria bacterium]|nr:RimK family protein [Gammaproteobacteria bacterium]MDH5515456.1 RimK family protein [Gammaproteobacteria bacterium]
MTAFYVVVENLGDWQPYYPSQDVITFDEYLERGVAVKGKRVRVINLCRSYRYLGTGYYCSLLAEARGHHVFPSVMTINDLGRKDLALLQLEYAEEPLKALSIASEENRLTFHCWFGQTRDKALARLAQSLFEKFPCPLLEITLEKKGGWTVRAVKAISLKALTDPDEQEAFANAFEHFSRKMWRKPKARKSYRYDLAMLVNPAEALPPCDEQALQHFESAANTLGIAIERITHKDYMRLPEYDGLFIRETTAVDHHTYRFAKKAEAEDMVVIDDPASILRCSNKVYLADLLRTHKIPTPVSVILNQPGHKSLKALAEQVGFPMVLKVPDGSFSRGIIKVNDLAELEAGAATLLKNSALLIAQEYLYTQYDWRIGVLNNKPLYACRYYMVDNHWQIYHHGETTESGDYDTLPTFEVPAAVLDAAVMSARLIGNGFYGVDIKQSADRVVVIEVNDNPSIESGVEDNYLGEQLYAEIMGEFLRRMEARGR